jgi:hypothetical protein
MSQIPIQKQVFGKDFSKVIDVEFKQLLQKTTDNNNEITIDEFFNLYEELFYQIPKEGESHSHRYILTRTVDHLGVRLADDTDVQALLQEITELRQELLDANKALNDLNGRS